MRILILTMLAAVGLFSTSCRTVCDARGPVEICEIHHAYMETVIIDFEQKPVPSQEYVEARFKYFLHSYPYETMPEKCKKCVVYVCPDCARAEQEWLWRHPQAK